MICEGYPQATVFVDDGMTKPLQTSLVLDSILGKRFQELPSHIERKESHKRDQSIAVDMCNANLKLRGLARPQPHLTQALHKPLSLQAFQSVR